jgi:signal transduction histidine kinase/CheY-like chemotaxis protein
VKIRTQLSILLVLFAVLLAIVTASLFFMNVQIEQIQKQRDAAHALELMSRELSYLSNDYLLHGESQQLSRWEEKFASYSELLSSLHPKQSESRALVEVIGITKDRLRAVFTDVSATLQTSPIDSSGGADLDRIRVSWSRMEIQNQAMAFDASRLARMLNDEADRLSLRRVVLLFVLIFIFGCFLTINYLTVNRRILRSLADLQSGTRVIGSGNLEYTIEEKRGDEIGDLARAFNWMTRQLRTVTVSKDRLEVEIEERKRAEEELRKAKEEAERMSLELEDRVRARTLQLEQASRYKDEFLANMSHEIRTPLTGVLGLTELLLQQNRSEEVRGDLEMIHGSALSVMSLINDLLDLSRIEKGKIVLSTKPVTIRGVMEELVKPYQVQAREKQLAFEWTVMPEVPEQVLCDWDRLGQVLKNLLYNAIKFTEKGSIRLECRVVEHHDQLVRLRFTVTDTGIGIPEEKLGEIFESFTQVDHSYSKRFAGAGLGLAISRELVGLMGGEISVQSEVGRGSSFVFTILTERAEPQPQDELHLSMTLSDFPPLSILLVEDNPVNRVFLRRTLTRHGHSVVEAENGLQALERLAERSFDLVLMDIQMPEMDGIEAMHRIRSGGYGRADIPIIALTAYAMKGDREKFMAEGMDGYVTKPVDFDELASTIEQAIK